MLMRHSLKESRALDVYEVIEKVKRYSPAAGVCVDIFCTGMTDMSVTVVFPTVCGTPNVRITSPPFTSTRTRTVPAWIHCTSVGQRLSSVRPSTLMVVPFTVALAPMLSAGVPLVTVEVVVVVVGAPGHAANSQAGPPRDTREPSGHVSVSVAHAWVPVGALSPRVSPYQRAASIASTRTPIMR